MILRHTIPMTRPDSRALCDRFLSQHMRLAHWRRLFHTQTWRAISIGATCCRWRIVSTTRPTACALCECGDKLTVIGDALSFFIRWEHETNLIVCTVVVLLFCAHDWLGSHLHLFFIYERNVEARNAPIRYDM